METDVQGCSTCEAGKENYEIFYSRISRKNLVQYDYRTPEGKLFSTCAPDLETCRNRKNKWLSEGNRS